MQKCRFSKVLKKVAEFAPQYTPMQSTNESLVRIGVAMTYDHEQKPTNIGCLGQKRPLDTWQFCILSVCMLGFEALNSTLLHTHSWGCLKSLSLMPVDTAGMSVMLEESEGSP